MRWIVAALLAALSLGAVATEAKPAGHTSILGIEMGKPLAFPKCPKGRYGLYSLPPPGQEIKGGCWAPVLMSADTPEPSGDVIVRYPSLEMPDYVIGDIEVALIDGLVKEVRFSTSSSDQELALDAFKAKFGVPRSLEKVPLQNAYGAQYSSYEAAWFPPGLEVRFYGMLSRDSGRVVIITADRAAELAEKQRALESAKIKL